MDNAAKTIALDDYAATLPVILKGVKRQSGKLIFRHRRIERLGRRQLLILICAPHASEPLDELFEFLIRDLRASFPHIDGEDAPPFGGTSVPY